MSKQDNLTDFLTDVADAIREKKGTTEKINPQNFSDEIRGIESGSTEYAISSSMVDYEGGGMRVIKEVIVAEGVTALGNYAFQTSAITSIILPSTLTNIGYSSFYSCASLKKITIPNSVTTISGRAFMACSNLVEVNIPSNLTSLGAESFQTCNISVPVVIPNGVKYLGTRAFYANAKVPYFDFRSHLSIPTLADINAFSATGTSNFVVPDALYDQWIVATNWTTYASRIVKASEFVEPTNE